MKIVTLLENTAKSPNFKSKHGLSVYIETAKHKLLFDLGPDDTFIHNAKELGIDLTIVDAVILSHGHYDHGGGLLDFLKINGTAKVYMSEKAFEPHYIKSWFKKRYIGLDKGLTGNERFILTGDTLRIDDELFLFSDVEGQFGTKSNNVLLTKTQQGYVRDDFAHEQNLIVETEGKVALFSGCSHRGVVNIMRTAHKHRPEIKAVFGGFHLHNPATGRNEPPKVAEKVAEELLAYETVCYTGHCTGDKAFGTMHGVLGDKVRRLSTGAEIEI